MAAEKDRNRVLSALDLAYTSPNPTAKPTQIQLETCNLCNLKCIFCPRENLPDIPRGIMPLEQVKLVEHLFPTAERIGLHGTGEPFLHRQFFELLKLAKSYGAETSLGTNLTMITEEVARKLVEDGAYLLVVSLDGATKRVFEKLRPPARFEQVLENLCTMQRIKREAGSPTPLICIEMVAARENYWQLPAMARLGHKLGVEMVDVSNVAILREEMRPHSVSHTLRFRLAMGLARRVARRLGVNFRYSYQYPLLYEDRREWYAQHSYHGPFGCVCAWTEVLVSLEGDVKACCFSDETWGNCFEQDLEEIWNGPAAADFRNRILTGDLPKQCIRCRNLIPLNHDVRTAAFAEATRRLEATGLPDEERTELQQLIETHRISEN